MSPSDVSQFASTSMVRPRYRGSSAVRQQRHEVPTALDRRPAGAASKPRITCTTIRYDPLLSHHGSIGKGCGVYREGIPAIGLSLEHGTDEVPNDDKYHIVIDGAIVASFAHEKRARDEYRRRRDALVKELDYSPDYQPLPPAEVMRRERVDRELTTIQSEASRAKHAGATRRGGKGR